MNRALALFAAAALFAACSAARYTVGPCADACRFVTCDAARAVLDVGGTTNDVALTGPICARDRRTSIGIINTEEAYVSTGSARPVPISKFANGAKAPFAKTLFKSFTIKYGDKYSPTKSGIGHETFQKAQGGSAAVHGLCLYVPVRHYQVLNKDGYVIDNINTPFGPLKHCVALYLR